MAAVLKDLGRRLLGATTAKKQLADCPLIIYGELFPGYTLHGISLQRQKCRRSFGQPAGNEERPSSRG